MADVDSSSVHVLEERRLVLVAFRMGAYCRNTE